MPIKKNLYSNIFLVTKICQKTMKFYDKLAFFHKKNNWQPNKKANRIWAWVFSVILETLYSIFLKTNLCHKFNHTFFECWSICSLIEGYSYSNMGRHLHKNKHSQLEEATMKLRLMSSTFVKSQGYYLRAGGRYTSLWPNATTTWSLWYSHYTYE